MQKPTKPQQSYGVIPIHKKTNEVLLVQLHAGHWSFPKGRTEPGESAAQTAARELEEEVGISNAEIDFSTPFSEKYIFEADGFEIHKTVTYFVGYVNQKDITIQEKELKSAGWFSIEDAMNQLTFDNARNILREAKNFIKQ